MDLSNLNLSELRALAEKIKSEIGSRQQSEMRKAREEIMAIAQSVGMSLPDLLSTGGRGGKGGTRATFGKPAAVKYQHPDDNTKTWTGRGRMPAWVSELDKAGKLDTARVST